jgi:hypothetical protein
MNVRLAQSPPWSHVASARVEFDARPRTDYVACALCYSKWQAFSLVDKVFNLSIPICRRVWAFRAGVDHLQAGVGHF